MDKEIFKSIESLHVKVDNLNEKVSVMPCSVNNNRLNNLEKVVYGAVKLILVGFIVSLVFLVMPKNSKPASANASVVKVK